MQRLINCDRRCCAWPTIFSLSLANMSRWTYLRFRFLRKLFSSSFCSMSSHSISHRLNQLFILWTITNSIKSRIAEFFLLTLSTSYSHRSHLTSKDKGALEFLHKFIVKGTSHTHLSRDCRVSDSNDAWHVNDLRERAKHEPRHKRTWINEKNRNVANDSFFIWIWQNKNETNNKGKH